MFITYCKEKARMVSAAEIDPTQIRRLNFSSHIDQSEMIYVSESDQRRAHFRHKTLPELLRLKYPSGETVNHRLGKQTVIEAILRAEPKANLIEEYVFDNGERIADVCLLRNGKPSEVYEIQLSRITSADLYERSDFYKKNGVTKIIWFFDIHKDWWRSVWDANKSHEGLRRGELEFYEEELSDEWTQGNLL